MVKIFELSINRLLIFKTARKNCLKHWFEIGYKIKEEFNFPFKQGHLGEET